MFQKLFSVLEFQSYQPPNKPSFFAATSAGALINHNLIRNQAFA
jgi:hypothetical protein